MHTVENMVSSDRNSVMPGVAVSSQEEDLLQRSKKKVKELSDPKTYKESLLKPYEGMTFAEGPNQDVQEEAMIESTVSLRKE